MKPQLSVSLMLMAAGLAAPAWAQAGAPALSLDSPVVAEGAMLPAALVFKGFGCSGGNLSPALTWSHAPAGTKSFALTVYDPDAPTGSGWWHWTVANIPANVTGIAAGASGTAAMPAGSLELRNDYGVSGFGGACPPPGAMHRYVFTVYALGVPRLDLPRDASNALAGFMIHAAALGQSSITAVYRR